MMLSKAEVPVLVLAEIVLVELWGAVSKALLCRTAGERRWRVTDVVGAEDGLGVVCLSGSGAIASAYYIYDMPERSETASHSLLSLAAPSA